MPVIFAIGCKRPFRDRLYLVGPKAPAIQIGSLGHPRNPVERLVPAKRQVQPNRRVLSQAQVARGRIRQGQLRQDSCRRQDLFDSVPDNQRDVLVLERGDG